LGVRALYLISRKSSFRCYSFGPDHEDNLKRDMFRNFDLFISISFTAAFILKFMDAAIQTYRGQRTFPLYYSFQIIPWNTKMSLTDKRFEIQSSNSWEGHVWNYLNSQLCKNSAWKRWCENSWKAPSHLILA
jgi:hypothetical protein